MARVIGLRTAAALPALLAVGVTGCTGSGAPAGPLPPAAPATSAAAPATSGPAGPDPVYTLPKSLCAVADQRPLADLFPTGGGKPVADSPALCATSRSSAEMAVSLSIDAELLKDARAARFAYETLRRTTRRSPTDVAGVGSAAFLTADPNKVELISYHGNLMLRTYVETVNDRHRLPGGVADRLNRVVTATYARLAPP